MISSHLVAARKYDQKNQQYVIDAVLGILSHRTPPSPRRISILSGPLQVKDLLEGSITTFVEELRVPKRVYTNLSTDFRFRGLIGYAEQATEVQLEEKVAIFLFITGRSMDVKHTSNVFRRSNHSVSNAVHTVFKALLAIYPEHVYLPVNRQADKLRKRYNVFKEFHQHRGYIDGTHVHVLPPKNENILYFDKDHQLTHKVLADALLFFYLCPGWEGSAHDQRVLTEVLDNNPGVPQPAGNYYLGDAG